MDLAAPFLSSLVTLSCNPTQVLAGRSRHSGSKNSRRARSGFAFLLLTLFFCVGAASSLVAQTNVPIEEIPPLLPPRGELPPSFSEQYGLWLVLGGVFLLAAVAAAIWFLTRPKPARMIPPAIEARAYLEALCQRTEDGSVLMRVSQVLRHYLAAAFEMPQEELTTTEFCQALSRVEQVGPNLSSDVARFLKQCDIRKFAPAPASLNIPKVEAVPQAFKLIDEAEVRLAQIREAAVVAPPITLNG